MGMAIMALAGSMLAGCDAYPDYRYRMTVEVETPQGVKSGSSVIEVQKGIFSMQSSTGRTFQSKVRGQAVAIDVAPGQTVFALLARPDDADYAKSVAFAALKPVRDKGRNPNDYAGELTAMTQIIGTHELPRDRWPLFVRFRDMRDPKTIVDVDPDDLRTIGLHGSVRRVTIAIVADPVTTGIEKRLPSFGPETGFDAWYRSLPFADPRQIDRSAFIRS